VPVVWDLQFRFQGQFESPKLAFVVLFAAAFSLSAGLATLGFHYVERPFMAMRRWPWQRTASVTPAAQPGAPPTSEPALAPRA
jgi:peptidoglycan/LPS O-acetylase OafA/YrhL